MKQNTFPLMALSRLRMGTDGQGVTTLAAAWGCPLRCGMCLNSRALRTDTPVKRVFPEEMYDMVKADDLYFQATGGGVTFGGGEPLMHAAFIRDFRKLCGGKWRLTAETCLNIPAENLEIAMECLDEFIVDVKDMDPGVYRRYTGMDNGPVIRNLERLLSRFDPEKVLVRVPNIPGYNTPEDVENSLHRLRRMGAKRFDVFTYVNP